MLRTTDKITLQSLSEKMFFQLTKSPFCYSIFANAPCVLILKQKKKSAECFIHEKEFSFRKELKKQLKQLQTDESFICNGQGKRREMKNRDERKQRRTTRDSETERERELSIEIAKTIRKHFKCPIVTKVLQRKSEIKPLSVSILLVFLFKQNKSAKLCVCRKTRFKCICNCVAVSQSVHP